MFFSQNILTKKGGSLGIVWIAANFQPGVHPISLTRRDYCSVSIRKACEEVVSPRNPMALRLSANLMVGIVRVHRQQTHYTYVELKHMWQKIKNIYEKNRPTTELPTGHTRCAMVTLPDPTTQVALNTTFPGEDYSFSLDSLVMSGLFSITAASETPNVHPAMGKMDGSPYTADPKDISMEEESEVPLDSLQVQVPGDGGDFGDSVLMECGDGPVVMVDNVAMPALNLSDDTSYVSGVGDCSSDGSLVGTGVVGEGVGREMEEEVEKEGGEKDSVLLFDEKTDSFQLYKENEGKVSEVQQGTPVLQPVHDQCAQPDLPLPQGRPSKRVRRKLAFDAQIKTKSSTIKENMATAQTTLRDKHSLVCPVPARVKPVALLYQPACVDTMRSPRLLAAWHSCQIQPDVHDQPEFELESLPEPNTALGLLHATPSVASILSDKEVAREHSVSRVVSPGGESALELRRAGDDKSLDSHQTTGLTATFSDLSSFASTRHTSNHGFETSSVQRQTQSSRIPLLNIDGLSPIADVDRETETSFNTQQGDLGFPDLDISYGSTGTVQLQYGHHNDSVVIDSEPSAYFSHVSHKMGERLQMEFQELLPPNSSRRTASRAFAHILELVTSQTLRATQDQPYATIVLHRGDRF